MFIKRKIWEFYANQALKLLKLRHLQIITKNDVEIKKF